MTSTTHRFGVAMDLYKQSLPRRASLLGIVMGVALIAAACGSSDPVTEASAPADETDTSTSSSAAPTTDDADGAQAEPSDSETAEETTPPAADATPHVFPDLSTTSIVDGTTINLADQLAGGDTPVLLWFFAPH
jgi:hypothetical protein